MVLSVRHRAKQDRKAKEHKHKQQLIDVPLDVLIEVRALRELIILNVQ